MTWASLPGVAGGAIISSAWAAQVKANDDASANAVVSVAGDTIYATAAGTLARLAIGANGTVNTVVGGVPAWSSSLSLGGSLTVANSLLVSAGGAYVSGALTLPTLLTTAGDLLVGSGGGATARLAKGSDGQVLGVAAGVLTWQTLAAAAPTDGPIAVGSLRTLGGGPYQAASGDHAHAAGVVDASAAVGSLRTLGTGLFQAAQGNHLHAHADLTGVDTNASTSAIHHTLGTGATQASAGNHDHAGVYATAGHTHGAAAPAAHVSTHQSGGSDALAASSVSAGVLQDGTVTPNKMQAGANWNFAGIKCESAGVFPETDNTQRSGLTNLRWMVVYAVNGTIQTSSRDAKHVRGSLDGAAALAAIRRTPMHRFTYKASDPALRDYQHVGFLAEEADPLLCPDGKSASPNTTGSVGLAAIQELDRRLTALEARP